MTNKKKCILFYTEGETEDEFYDCILEELKKKYNVNKFNTNKIIKKCLKGICRFDKKLINKYENEIKNKYKDYDVIVFLCYDTDYFEFGLKPSIDWNYINEKLYLLGASKVYHIKANKCIEDFMLYDIEGICKYLKIKKPSKLKGKTGIEKMEYLFSLGNRIYQKGYPSENFIKSLNMNIIIDSINNEISPIINELFKN